MADWAKMADKFFTMSFLSYNYLIINIRMLEKCSIFLLTCR